MAGADENLVVMSDWCPPSPSPRTFFSSLLRDGISAISRSNVPKDNEGQCLPPGPVNQKAAISLEDEANEAGGEGLLESNALSVQKPSPRSSLAERMAARAGFSAPILNTSRIVDLSTPSPEGRSTFLTIPPGLSPTTLFDSPVFLSNSLSQQSPTTGKFSFPPLGERGPIPLSTASKEGKDGSFGNINVAPFAFKPHLQSSSSCFSSGANIVAAPTSQHQPLPRIEVSVLPAQPTQAQNLEVTTSQQELQPYQIFSDEAVKQNITCLMSNEIACHNAENKQSLDALEEVGEDYRGEFSSTVVEAPSEDGYNWRKYGQKQVKGSEFPRSYYKCTHPNCQVKKKVERSYEGHVTEIIYKGAHSHPKPPASRGSAFGSSSQPPTDQQKGDQVGMDVERSMWGGTGNCMETGSSEFCDPSTTGPVQDRRGLQTPPLDVSSPESNADDDDDEADGTVSLVHDDEGDESESKRRKMDSSVTEMCGATRAIREPRVVVQTTSEVDVLDDGYRWRKYGQKVVKGNPNPRSYYKCTNTGCTVRKHVERASHDLKAVITTYEGKHNHDVPAAKTNSHVNSGPSSLPTLPPVPFLPRQQPSQLHGEMPRFENPVLNTFGLPGRQLSGPTGFSFAVGQQSFSNLAMARLGSATQGKMPGLQMQHSYFGHQVKVNELGLMISKGEPKKESMLESNLPVGHGSSVYYQLMSRLPL